MTFSRYRGTSYVAMDYCNCIEAPIKEMPIEKRLNKLEKQIKENHALFEIMDKKFDKILDALKDIPEQEGYAEASEDYKNPDSHISPEY